MLSALITVPPSSTSATSSAEREIAGCRSAPPRSAPVALTSVTIPVHGRGYHDHVLTLIARQPGALTPALVTRGRWIRAARAPSGRGPRLQRRYLARRARGGGGHPLRQASSCPDQAGAAATAVPPDAPGSIAIAEGREGSPQARPAGRRHGQHLHPSPPRGHAAGRACTALPGLQGEDRRDHPPVDERGARFRGRAPRAGRHAEGLSVEALERTWRGRC